MPGSSSRFGLGNSSAQRDLPGIGIDLGFGKQQLAGNRIDRSVVEHEADLGRVGRDPVEIAAVERAAQLVHLDDRLGEVGIDRVELLDRGETGGLVLHHQRAFADQRGADDAVDRRADRRIIEIEPGARDFGLAAADLGLGLALGRDGLFVLGLGRRALAGQRRDAPRMLGGQIERSHRPCRARLRSPAVRPRTACGSIRYSGSPAFTSVPCWNRRSTTMPETRARTSETRVGAIRPGNSRTRARDCGRDGDDADFRFGRLGRCGRGDRFIAASQKRRHRSQHQYDACRSRSKSGH